MNGSVAERDEDARRWARPRAGRVEREPERASDAAAWVRPPARRERSADFAGDGVPLPERVSAIADPRARVVDTRSAVPVAIGAGLLAVLACIPHWVAPTISLIAALVGLPIAWAWMRISRGRRRVQYVVVVLTLLLTAVLAVAAPLLWLQAGVLEPIRLPS